jgi:filamentous hemagglutinin family protein
MENRNTFNLAQEPPVRVFVRHKKLVALPILALGLLLVGPVHAGPQNGSVVAGSATITSAPGSTTITQTTPKVAIEWKTFSIPPGESVMYVQPNSQSVALNRVIGSDPSLIFGSLTSNGQVFLINPAGILFGKSAQVNVGALVASTLQISNLDFMAGRFHFTDTGGTGEVVNQGTIQTQADGSYAALLGKSVRNGGTIVARMGSVALAAGDAITLDMVGDGLLNVVVDKGALQAQVDNGGMLLADGGLVLLTTQAADKLLHTAVNSSGVIEAKTIGSHNGTIRLLGDMLSGTVNVGGTLNATGGALSGNGGLIETSAANVKVADTAHIDTSAPHGLMGTWLLDPNDFVISLAGGDLSTVQLVASLLASNVTIFSDNGSSGTMGNIYVNDAVSWTGASTLTLNAVHDVLVNAPVTSNTAGSKFVVVAGNDISTTLPLTVVAAGSTISLTTANDIHSGGTLNAIAAGSNIVFNAGNDLFSAGAVTATAANSNVLMTAVRDVNVSAAMIAVAAASTIRLTAGRDINTSTTAAIAGSAAKTQLEFMAGHDININSAVAAGAAGSGVKMYSGLSGTRPGVASGTVKLSAAVAAPTISIRFNPDGYIKTNTAIAQFTAGEDARAWVYLQANNKVYDSTTSATIAMQGTPTDGGKVLLLGGSASFADKNAGVGKKVSYTGYQLGGLDANHFALFPSTGTALATITPRVVLVTATGASKVYDGTTTTNVTLADQRLKGDQLTVSYGSANFVDANVGNAKVIGVAGIQLSGTDAANYNTSSTASTAANVTPTVLTVTAANAQKTYGDTSALTGFTSVGLVAGETIGSVQETSAGSVPSAGVVGGPYVITPSNAAGGTFAASNYKIVYGNASLTVLPAPLLITVQNDTKMFGTFNNDNAFTVKGLVNGDTIGGFTIFNPGGPASATVAGSPYPVAFSNPTAGTYVATNYQTVYVSGKLFVLPWPLAVLNAMAVWPVAYTLDIKPDMKPLITVDEEQLPLRAQEE